MKRTKKSFEVDTIITGDWHLRDSIPKCRTDNFWKEQWDKVNQVRKLQKEYNCSILFSGDLFHTWKSTPYLINETIDNLIGFHDFETVIGNHDMPSHNPDLMQQSAWQTLLSNGNIQHVSNHGDWGMEHNKKKHTLYAKIKNRKIKILHLMTYKGKEPWPGCKDPKGNKLFKMFPEADLIVTGHNHQTFTIEKNGKLLINPGSLTRQNAKEVDHKPAVFFWNAKFNTFKIHYLNFKKDVISREHIEIQKHKEERASAFIEKLKDNWDIGLSFEENIEKAFQENDINKNIKEIVLKWMGI